MRVQVSKTMQTDRNTSQPDPNNRDPTKSTTGNSPETKERR